MKTPFAKRFVKNLTVWVGCGLVAAVIAGLCWASIHFLGNIWGPVVILPTFIVVAAALTAHHDVM